MLLLVQMDSKRRNHCLLRKIQTKLNQNIQIKKGKSTPFKILGLNLHLHLNLHLNLNLSHRNQVFQSNPNPIWKVKNKIPKTIQSKI